MKKYIIPFVLIFAFITTASAYDLDKLIAELAKAENVEYKVIDQTMLQQMNQNISQGVDSPDEEESSKIGLMSKMESIEVLDLGNCSDEVKAKFIEQVNSFQDGDGYESLLNVKGDGDKVLIVAKKEGEIFKGTYILVSEEDADKDNILVKISGSFTESEMQELVNMQKTQMNK